MDDVTGAMDGGDPREEIARLEEQIEALADGIERCRKYFLASKVAIVSGVILALLMLFGAIAVDPLDVIVAIAALLGGIVLLGSNSSTWKQTIAAMQAAETRRAALIGILEMQPVNDGRTLR